MMATNIITQAELKALLHYDPLTGVFTNAKWRGKRGAPGAVAGHVNSHGYVKVKIRTKIYSAHRLAWLYVYGAFPAAEIDHIDRNRANNKIANLRNVTGSENCQNISVRCDNSSGYKGVGWHKQHAKWRARIMLNGKHLHLGLFAELVDAAAAYTVAATRFHPNRPA